MSHFNAVLIGGPPHSGKSVLTYSLTQTLRQLGVEHYVLRACPDGEGDWSNETPPDTVRLIRQKGRFTAEFVARVTQDLGRRHLPLLVDVGGRPEPEQEIIFTQCTHAILLARDLDGLSLWRDIADRNGLRIIAELLSCRDGEPAIESDGQHFRARLTGLERHQRVGGPVFDALARRVANFLFESPDALRHRHLAAAPVELAVDIQDVARQLGIHGAPTYWLPEHLGPLLRYLPEGVSTGIYGRGPNWLFAALAAHTNPAPFFQFDVRLGWTAPCSVVVGTPATAEVVTFGDAVHATHRLLEIIVPGYYLDRTECGQLVAPQLPCEQGIVISGRVPHWLLTGVVAAYLGHPWLAIYQPTLTAGAVVVHSRVAEVAVGDVMTLARKS